MPEESQILNNSLKDNMEFQLDQFMLAIKPIITNVRPSSS